MHGVESGPPGSSMPSRIDRGSLVLGVIRTELEAHSEIFNHGLDEVGV